MTLEYELSEKECLKFLKKTLPNTIYYKKSFITYLIFSIILIFLTIIFNLPAIILFPNSSLIMLIISFFLILSILLYIINLKKIIFSAFEKRFKNTIKFSPIFLYKLTLKICNDTLTIQSKYESITIPLSEITIIYLSDNYIFLLNEITKDILIPNYIFPSIQDKTNFLNIFNKKNIPQSFSCLANYKFI